MLVQEYLKNKEYSRSKDKAKIDVMYEDIYNCICQNTKKMKIYYPVCQTYSPTGAYKSISKRWTNMQEASG